jgi:hypothetical protein
MPLEVIVEDGTGVPDANSYASVADADAYVDTRPRSDAWVSLTDDAKAQFLIHATRYLDGAVDWSGDPTSDTQSLAFPRSSDSGTEAALPQAIKLATIELAIEMVSRDITSDATMAGLRSIKVGPIEIEADSIRPSPALPRFVRDLIAPYGTARGSSANVSLIRR